MIVTLELHAFTSSGERAVELETDVLDC